MNLPRGSHWVVDESHPDGTLLLKSSEPNVCYSIVKIVSSDERSDWIFVSDNEKVELTCLDCTLQEALASLQNEAEYVNDISGVYKFHSKVNMRIVYEIEDVDVSEKA